MTYKPSLEETIEHDLGEEWSPPEPEMGRGEWTVILSAIAVIGFGSAVYFVDYVSNLSVL
jgi:hypothetical protein